MGFIIEKESSNFGAYEMDFKLEAGGTTIQFRDQSTLAILEVQPANTIEAVANGVNVKIQLLGGKKVLIDSLILSKISINSLSTSEVQATALNELNTLFANVGATGSPPIITSPATINLVVGNTLNFTMTGTDIVAYGWENLPTGILTVEGKLRSIIGGSALPMGTYNFIARATNYYGEITQNVTLTVGTSFINTYSTYGGLSATTKHFLIDSALTSQTASPLFRSSNSIGNASDATQAWSVAFWHKSQATHNAWWGAGFGSIFGVGGTRQNRSWAGFDCHVYGDTTKTVLQIIYGSKWSYVSTAYELTGTSLNDWKQIIVSYNGGDTESTTNPGGSTGVLDCFSVSINGVNVPITSNTIGNTGFSGIINADGFSGYHRPYDVRIMAAVYGSTTYHSNKLNIDEIGFYDYVLSSSNITAIYDGGNPQSLHNITGVTNPLDYFRCGDGIDSANSSNTDLLNFPNMYNFYSGRFNMEAQNMTVADYVSDVP